MQSSPQKFFQDRPASVEGASSGVTFREETTYYTSEDLYLAQNYGQGSVWRGRGNQHRGEFKPKDQSGNYLRCHVCDSPRRISLVHVLIRKKGTTQTASDKKTNAGNKTEDVKFVEEVEEKLQEVFICNTQS